MRFAVSTEDLPEKPATAEFPRAFFGVIAMQFVFGLAVSTFTILPSVVVRHLRGSSDDVGVYAAALAFGALAAAPVAGFVLDRVGRKTVIQLACLGAAASSFLFASFLDVRGIALPLLFVSGATFVMIVNGLSTLVADLAPSESIARAVGWQGAATMIANAISPTMAEHFAPTFGWHAPFFASGGICLLLVAIGFFLPKDRTIEIPADRARVSPRAAITALAPLLLTAFLAGAAFTAISTFQQPHLLARGASSVRDYFIGFSVGALVMRLGFGSLPDRLGLPRATRSALAGYALVSLAFTAIVPPALGLGGLTHGLVHGVLYPSMVALSFRTVGAESRGLAASFTLGAFNGGSALGGLAFGAVARATDTTWVFVCGAACALVGIAFVREPAQRGTSTV